MGKEENGQIYAKVSTNEQDTIEKPEIPPTYGYGVRHTQLLLMFFYITSAFLARSHIGVTIVAMTKTLPRNIENSTLHYNDTIRYDNETGTSGMDLNVTDEGSNVTVHDSWSVYQEYRWSKPVQEMVLGAFFIGYCAMMFPIGLVCQRWGGKLPLQISMLVNGVVSILTPWLAMLGGWKALCCCRVLQGLSQSGTLPGIQTLLSQWVSSSEKATLSSYVYIGMTVGITLAFQISGVICSTALGWPGAFWVVGVICLMMFVLLTAFGAATPAHHKKITEAEKLYIIGFKETIVKKSKTPWKAILTSKAVWAVYATQGCCGMIHVLFTNQVPTYMHYILEVNVNQSGLLSSLPLMFTIVTGVIFGFLSDYLTNKQLVSPKNARRIFNSIAEFGVAVMMVVATYANSTTTSVICLTLGMGCFAGIHCGWMINAVEIAPVYIGPVTAIGNTLMNFGNILVPAMVSGIVIDVRNLIQWRILIFMLVAISAVSNVIFITFVSTEVQPWNESKEDYEVVDTKLEHLKKEEENKKQ